MTACLECDVDVSCKVFVLSKYTDWGEENPHFVYCGCDFTVFSQLSAFTSIISLVKVEHEKKNPPPNKPRIINRLQAQKALFDKPVQIIVDRLECDAKYDLRFFAKKDGSFPQEVLLLERDMSSNSFSLAVLEGIDRPAGFVVEKSNLTRAIEKRLGMEFIGL